MNRMHKPDPKLASDQQDKRSIVAIEAGDIERWLQDSTNEAAKLLAPPAVELINADPA